MDATSFQQDISAIGSITAVSHILAIVCRTTGMGFAAVARVTEDRWIACQVRDEISFGLKPGEELAIEKTLCQKVREARNAIVIDCVADDELYRHHPVPAMYGIQSYISMPILRCDGSFFGTLCAVDPKPAYVSRLQTVEMFKLFAELIASHLDASDRLGGLEQQVVERTAERERAWRLSRDLLVATTASGTLTAVNQAWTRLLGWEEEELIGAKLLSFTHPDDHGATVAALATVLERPLTEPHEHRFRHKNGTYRWVAWTAAFESGKVYANGRDITAEHEQAAALAGAEAALRQSQKMEAVGQLTGGIAHDFNNLLQGIIGSLELLANRVSEGRLKDVERYIGVAQGAAKRAAALTHRLLAFSRRQTLDPSPTDVNRLVAGMEEMIRRMVGPEIEIEVVAAAGLWPALVDPNQLENALLNLCINARDAMPQGGRITVETANTWLDAGMASRHDLPAGQYLSLCVTDTGTGMTPEVVARAFDPFFTTKPLGQGTGLGLSMIYGFTRQSGGQVRIFSELGQGTTMCLYLPRHHGHGDGPLARPELAEAPHAERGQTVLVIDDEPTVRMLVTDVLEDLGYIAIQAADGAAGLRVLQSDVRIDLLVTDVGLPGGLNGRQVAEAGRLARPDLKVLFITGYAEHSVVGEAQLDPGMHLLTKPFAMQALASRINELIVGR